MTSVHPTFSVVVPLYNKRPYIRRAVESVLAQTVTDFELIIVDDGSTDGSLEALADVSDSRLLLIRQANMGGAGGQARNRGMAQAKGTWFAFLDGDDMWLPNHLEEIGRIIEQDPDPGLVSTRPIEAPDGQPVEIDRRSEPGIRRIDYFHTAAKAVGFNNCSSSAIHRDVFNALGGFINVRSGPDLEYWARIALRFPVTISDCVTSVYYRGTGGNMEQISRAHRAKAEFKTLREVSPSIALLCDRAQEDPELWSDPGIRAYVNGRLQNGIKGAMYRDELGNARRLAEFMMPPLTRNQRSYQLAARLPSWVLLLGIEVFKKLRNH